MIEHVKETYWRVDSDRGKAIYDVHLDVPSCTCQGWVMSIARVRKAARERGDDERLATFRCKHIDSAAEAARFQNLPDGTKEQEERLKQYEREKAEEGRSDILSEFGL